MKIGNKLVNIAKVLRKRSTKEETEEKKDKIRDMWFKEQVFKVLRFWNNDVFINIKGILEAIRENCFKTTSPNPSHQGRGMNKV